MQQGKEKRNQFRKQIRQRHINQLFKNVRNQHKQRQKTSATVVILSEEKKKQFRQAIGQFIYKSMICNQSKDYQSLLKEITAISKLVYTMPDAFSACLNEQLMSRSILLIDGTKKDVSKLALERIGDPVVDNSSKIEEEVPIQTHLLIVDQLMQLSAQIKYQKFGQQSAILMTKVMWNVFSSNYHLPIKPLKQDKETIQKSLGQFEQRLRIFNNLCKSLSNLLDSPHHIMMKKHFQQLGLSKKLNQVINYAINFPIDAHLNFLKLLYLYNSNDLTQQNQEISINGITISSTDSTYKARFVTYCIFCLKKPWPELYQPALNALNEIIEENPYFIDSLKDDYFGSILRLIESTDRKTNMAALYLLCTFVFYSASATDQLVEKYKLLDVMFTRLSYQKMMIGNEPNIKNSIQKCTNILCDVLLTKDRKIKKLVLQHSVWEMLFESLQENNRLFSTSIVFKFFFNAIARKDIFNFLPSFLQTVRYLPLENNLIPQIKQIKQTLLNIYQRSLLHYPEQEHEQTIRLFETNGLLRIIDDFENEYARNNIQIELS